MGASIRIALQNQSALSLIVITKDDSELVKDLKRVTPEEQTQFFMDALSQVDDVTDRIQSILAAVRET